MNDHNFALLLNIQIINQQWRNNISLCPRNLTHNLWPTINFPSTELHPQSFHLSHLMQLIHLIGLIHITYLSHFISSITSNQYIPSTSSIKLIRFILYISSISPISTVCKRQYNIEPYRHLLSSSCWELLGRYKTPVNQPQAPPERVI